MNTNSARKASTERGTALLVALSCVLVLGLLGAGAAELLRQRTYASSREVNARIAQKLAEGGIERGLSWFTLGTNMNKLALPVVAQAFDLSEGHVAVVLDVPQGVMTSTATVRNVTATSKLLFNVASTINPAPVDPTPIIACGIMTDWDITGNGNATLRGNADIKVHSNHLMDIQNIYKYSQKVASSTAAVANVRAVKTGTIPLKQQNPKVVIPVLNWVKLEQEAKTKSFSYQDMTQSGKTITRSNFFQTAADFVNVVNCTNGATLQVTGPVYIKTGPLTCGSFKINGGPLIIEGDVDVRVTGGGVITISNTSAWPISIAWKGGELYFGGNSVSTFDNYIYSENGGYMDFQGTSFALTGGIFLRGVPASGAASLSLNGTPDLNLVPMDPTKLVDYFGAPDTPITTTTFTLYAWQ